MTDIVATNLECNLQQKQRSITDQLPEACVDTLGGVQVCRQWPFDG